MRRLPEIIRIVKCVSGIVLIVCFFLPWVAQTPSCADKSVIIRDNIAGFTLVREGTATAALAAPLVGAVVAALALAVRGGAVPLARSIVSLAEIPTASLPRRISTCRSASLPPSSFDTATWSPSGSSG